MGYREVAGHTLDHNCVRIHTHDSKARMASGLGEVYGE
jgi:hypothetical protein